jgi:uncharacterized protein (TIGR02757 family)
LVRLTAHLERLYRRTDQAARLRSDPVRFVHRYETTEDREVAGLIAAALAFGRVGAFGPVVSQILDTADTFGGPRAWVNAGAPNISQQYRWIRSADLTVWLQGVDKALAGRPVADLFFPASSARQSIEQASAGIREGVEAVTQRPWSQQTRGVCFLVPSPVSGSGCKRWNMYLRWMVRPDLEGIDFGLWDGIGPSQLVIPVDTHVLRISRFLGLTERTDGSWRTAEAITAALRQHDFRDPTRFDFAMAHLGISGQCKGRFDTDICPDCPLYGPCIHHEGTDSSCSTR